MISARPGLKATIVFGGLIVAAAAAWLAIVVNQWLTSGPDAQASSGMYAFGDLVLGIGVFALLATVPLGLALFWLRPVGWFWTAVTWIGGVYALTGPLALLDPGPDTFLSGLRMMMMPLGAGGLLLFSLVAPRVNQRWLLLAAALLEGAIFAGIVLFRFVLARE